MRGDLCIMQELYIADAGATWMPPARLLLRHWLVKH